MEANNNKKNLVLNSIKRQKKKKTIKIVTYSVQQNVSIKSHLKKKERERNFISLLKKIFFYIIFCLQVKFTSITNFHVALE